MANESNKTTKAAPAQPKVAKVKAAKVEVTEEMKSNSVKTLTDMGTKMNEIAMKISRCADMLTKDQAGESMGTDPLGGPITREQVIDWATAAMKEIPKKAKLA